MSITVDIKRDILQAIVSGTIDAGLVETIRKQIGERQQAAIERMTPAELRFGCCLAARREGRKLTRDDQAFYDQTIERWNEEI